MKNGICALKIFAIVVQMAWFCIASIQGQSLKFTNIATKQGLSHNTAYQVLQRRNGEMLIATQDGFNRFNGYDFHSYYNDPADSTAISNDNSSTIVEDNQERIWIGTWGGGINQFDSKHNQFKHLLHDDNDPKSISDNRVQALYYDSTNQCIWVGTFSGGLNRLNINTSTFRHLSYQEDKSSSISNNRIWAIKPAGPNHLWIGTDKGLNKFNLENETFQRFYIKPKQKDNVILNRVRAIYQTISGKVFIGGQEGFYRFNEVSKKFQFIDIQKEWHSNANVSITNFYEHPKNTLWIGTQRNGLIRYNIETGAYTQYLHNPQDPTSIAGNDIRHIFVDASGVFWISIRRGGVSIFNLQSNKFDHHKFVNNESGGLSDRQILSVFQDKAGDMWIGTLVGGMNRISPDGKFLYYQWDAKNSGSLAHPEVRSTMQSKDGNIWLASNRSLQRLDTSNNQFVTYNYNYSIDQSISDDRISILFEDMEGLFWLGTRENGLIQFHRNETRFEGAPNPHSKKYANVINDILDASRKFLWVATEAGLFKFDKRSKTFQYIEQASKHSINDMEPGENGSLWLATTQGLLKFNTRNATTTAYTKRNGLPSNQLNSLVLDNEGFLWIGTTRGLSKFDPITESFRNYDEDDGLQGNIFTPKASFKCPDGKLIFGGQNGFNVFYPNQLQSNTRPPKVMLTAFSKMGKEFLDDYQLQNQKSIELSHEEFLFSFEFTALDYTAPSKNQYAYRLLNLEEDWINAGNNRIAKYNKVPPGEYIFQVKASNNDGVWNESGASIRLIIHPPFWRTWWFYSSVFIFVIGSITLIVFWRIASLNSARKELAHRVETRTQQLRQERDKLKEANTRISLQIEEIEAQRDEIEAQRNDISNKNKNLTKALDEIQWQNREIKTQKEEIERKSTDLEYAQSLIKDQNIKLTLSNQALEEKVQQRTAELKKAYSELLRTHKQLDHFSYRSAHDLKGPIARLIGLCYIARMDINKDNAADYLDKLEYTAKEMDRLLSRMMRTQEIKNWHIHIKKTNLKKLIKEQWEATCIDESMPEIELLYTEPKAISFETDESLLKVLFHNLFENSIRFSSPQQKDKKVWVNVALSEKDQLVITIKDNGIGVPEEVTHKIFDMFVVGNNMGKGAGIGLYEASIITNRLKGKIWLKEHSSGNTTFELILPLFQNSVIESDPSFVISNS